MADENTLHEQTQSVIKSIIRKCEVERKTKSLMVPIDYAQERAAFYTGIAKDYIVALSKVLPTNSSEHSLSLHRRKLIMEGLLHFYELKKLPTINELYEFVNKKETIVPPLVSFTQELEDIGYFYRKTTVGYLLMEDPGMTFERYHYLKKKLKFRKNLIKALYYMDVRVLDENCTFPKATEGMDELILSKSLLFCYLASQNGTIEGMFFNYLSRDEIVNWLRHTVTPRLPSGSVIVISNNYLYEQETKPPSAYASKYTMIKWLQTNNIPCSDNMRKADLYYLISNFPAVGENRNVDTIFTANGHEVLRLPSSLPDLIPTEALWQDIKFDLQNKRNLTLYSLKEHVLNYTKVPLACKWFLYEKNIEQIEKSLFGFDEAMEVLLDSYNFEINDPLFKCQLNQNPFSYRWMDNNS